jgi:hypothetical protein
VVDAAWFNGHKLNWSINKDSPVFFSFMEELRSAGISASLKEHLALLEALNADVISQSPEEFYYLARTTLVKDEALLDRSIKSLKASSAITARTPLMFRKIG